MQGLLQKTFFHDVDDSSESQGPQIRFDALVTFQNTTDLLEQKDEIEKFLEVLDDQPDTKLNDAEMTLLGSLVDESPFTENGDADQRTRRDIVKTVLKILNRLFQPSVEHKDGDPDPALNHVTVFLQNPDHFGALVRLLDYPKKSILSRLIPILTCILDLKSSEAQNQILMHPLAVNTVVDYLERFGQDDEIRPGCIDLLLALVHDNIAIQKMAAFQGVFEKLFAIAFDLLGSEDSNDVADRHACLMAVLELLRDNSHNQDHIGNMEENMIPSLSQFLQLGQGKTEDELQLALEIVSQITSSIATTRKTQTIKQTKDRLIAVLPALVDLSFGHTDSAVRGSCFRCIGYIIRSHTENQRFVRDLVLRDYSYVAEVIQNGAWRQFGMPKPQLESRTSLSHFLLAALEAPTPGERNSAEFCLSAYFCDNATAQVEVARSFDPASASQPSEVTSEFGLLLLRALENIDNIEDGTPNPQHVYGQLSGSIPFDRMVLPIRLSYRRGSTAARILSYVLRDNHNVKSTLLQTNLNHPSANGEQQAAPPNTPLMLLFNCIYNMSYARDPEAAEYKLPMPSMHGAQSSPAPSAVSHTLFYQREKERTLTCLTLLQVLCEWMRNHVECQRCVFLSESTRDFILNFIHNPPRAQMTSPSPSLIEQAEFVLPSVSVLSVVHVRGFCTYALALCLETVMGSASPEQALSHDQLFDIIVNKVGFEQFRDHLRAVMSDDLFKEAAGSEKDPYHDSRMYSLFAMAAQAQAQQSDAKRDPFINMYSSVTVQSFVDVEKKSDKFLLSLMYNYAVTSRTGNDQQQVVTAPPQSAGQPQAVDPSAAADLSALQAQVTELEAKLSEAEQAKAKAIEDKKKFQKQVRKLKSQQTALRMAAKLGTEIPATPKSPSLDDTTPATPGSEVKTQHALEELKKAHAAEKKDLCAQIDQLKHHAQQLEARQKVQAEATVSTDSTEALQQLHQQNESLTAQLNEMKHYADTQTGQLEQFRTENDLLHTQLSSLNARVSEYQQQIQHMQDLSDRDAPQPTVTNSADQQRLTELESQLTQYQQNAQQVAVTMDGLNAELSASQQALEQERSDAKAEIAKRDQQLQSLQEQLHQLEQQVQESQDTNAHASEVDADLRQKYSKLEAELEDLLILLGAEEIEKRNLHVTIQNLHQELFSAQQQLADLQGQLQSNSQAQAQSELPAQAQNPAQQHTHTQQPAGADCYTQQNSTQYARDPNSYDAHQQQYNQPNGFEYTYEQGTPYEAANPSSAEHQALQGYEPQQYPSGQQMYA